MKAKSIGFIMTSTGSLGLALSAIFTGSVVCAILATGVLISQSIAMSGGDRP
jgi:hypothetical protein